jgi:molybdenum cofactor sulfurtransferase
MCNPGGSVALLGLQAPMAQLSNEPEVSMATLERLVGHRLGVVRVSLGLASNFEDAWRVVEFVRDMADERKRTVMRDAWRMSPSFAAYKESFGDV